MPHYSLGLEGDDPLVEFVAASLDGPVLQLDGAAAVDDWVVELERGSAGTGGALVDCFMRQHLGRPVLMRVVMHDLYEFDAMEHFRVKDGLTDSEGHEVRSLGR